MSEPFFSVIVPAHNSAKYIRRLLDSIKAQTFLGYELIVVCDSCTDDTALIASEYTDSVYQVEYGRDGLTRNAGLNAATGKWVLFADDDDWWLHEFAFQLLYNVLNEYGEAIDILAFDFIWAKKGYAPQHQYLTAAVWNKAWRREFIGDTRFPGIWSTSDAVFHKNMMEKNPRVITYNTPLYYYNYMREGSITWIDEHGPDNL